MLFLALIFTLFATHLFLPKTVSSIISHTITDIGNIDDSPYSPGQSELSLTAAPPPRKQQRDKRFGNLFVYIAGQLLDPRLQHREAAVAQ
jgi:hypothetical protein